MDGAAAAAGSLDYWRGLFRAANADAVEAIECAILVAAADCPGELRARRDRIAEMLFACRLPGCGSCDPAARGSVRKDGGRGPAAAQSSDPVASNYSYSEAEALTEEIEEEGETVGEVMRIKELLSNHRDESDDVLFESLRRLQLMVLSVETLKATDIGRAVNVLRKHGSKRIRQLVRTLIEDWKVLVDEWVSATAAIADISPASVDPLDAEEDEGLPSPPLDEGAFFTTQTSSIQLSDIFDGMDEDGNLRSGCEFDENQGGKNKTEKFESVRNHQIPEEKGWTRQEQVRKAPNGHMRPQDINVGDVRMQESATRQTKPQGIVREKVREEPVVRQTKPDIANGQTMLMGNKQSKYANADSGPGNPSRFSPEKKASNEMYTAYETKPKSSFQDAQYKHTTTSSGPGRPQKLSSDRNACGLQKNQPASVQDNSKNSEDSSLRAKLEAAKRKLQENYQNAENAKKQRTIRVMEVNDVPKRAQINRHPAQKRKSGIRNLFNGRR